MAASLEQNINFKTTTFNSDMIMMIDDGSEWTVFLSFFQ